jgi:hypothetical protein
MNWTEIIKGEIEHSYKTADGLIGMVDNDKLNWKPATGSNWMTTGQLLLHLATACGAPCKGFVTGDWGMPADVDPSKLNPEDMLPPAEKLPSLATIAEARQLLEQDKQTALAMVIKAGEADLANKPAPAPWDPRPVNLGLRLLSMVDHLNQHKGQLFYYLKLQGKPVNTGHLWGM